MFFADLLKLLDLLQYPFMLLMLLVAFAWYTVFRPPKGERFTHLRKRAIRRREMYRAFFLLIAVGGTLALMAVAYSLLSEKVHR